MFKAKAAKSNVNVAAQQAVAARTKANAHTTAQPGIISSICNQLIAAKKAKQPVTAQQLLASLSKQFPTRTPAGMLVTVRAQLSRLPRERDFAITKTRDGRVVKYSAA